MSVNSQSIADITKGYPLQNIIFLNVTTFGLILKFIYYLFKIILVTSAKVSFFVYLVLFLDSIIPIILLSSK